MSDIADMVRCKMHMSDNPNNSECKLKDIAYESRWHYWVNFIVDGKRL